MVRRRGARNPHHPARHPGPAAGRRRRDRRAVAADRAMGADPGRRRGPGRLLVRHPPGQLMSLFGRRESRNLDWWGAGFDGPPAAGRIVTPESAVYLAPVFAAIRHLVDYAATSDLDAYRDNGDGTRAEVSLPQFLRQQDAPGKAGLGQFIGQAMYGIVAHGNAVGWK